jgi:gamma-glutamylcyclotransferase (GGCT)/AIG2-like uncharacterized protein YtfP
MMMKTIYLAYGSNLNLGQMTRRCATAWALGSVKLKGYKLTFRGMDGGAVANIEPDAAGVVPGLLWELRPADEAALDRYEGFPHLYHKETVTVTCRGNQVKAMVYVMNEGLMFGTPGGRYYNVIRQGYRQACFDIGTLDQAVKAAAFPEEEPRYKIKRYFRMW